MRLAFIVAGALALVPAIARADAESCVAASDEGQKLRDEGHLRAARAKLTTCAAEECPSPVRANCVQWLDDVDKRTPSIVVAATANGKDATDVAVSIDGAVITQRLDGSAIPLDPGQHKIRYEHAGDPPQDDTIILREGEKDRALRVTFGNPIIAAPQKKRPTLAYTMTGVAIGSAVAWGAFALTSFLVAQGYDDCTSGGKLPTECNQSSNQTITLTTAVLADVSLAVAVVTTGIAIWAFVKHAHAPATTAGVRFDLARGVVAF